MSLNIQTVPGVRTSNIQHRTPWGVCLHTTGSGITTAAKKQGKTPLEVALHTYINSQNGSNGYPWGGPGYLIDLDGGVHRLADDTTHTNHVGSIVNGVNRRDQYLSGGWRQICAPKAVAAWDKKWGAKYKNPQELFPSKYPNSDFVGVEIIPIGNGFGGIPIHPGYYYSQAQHKAAAMLCEDIALRNNFPTGWAHTSRLVGHEDVGLIDRHDSKGGWDPGFLRENPHFDFDYVRAYLNS